MSYDFTAFKSALNKAFDHINQDIQTLRTGKATPQLVDPVRVEAYGTTLGIQEVASVSAPDPTLLVITPWDKSILENIEKAIASAGLNFNPVVDGDLIRIMVPPLTGERRDEMIKLLAQKIEAGKKMLRTVRIDTKKTIEDLKGTTGVSEDDIEHDLEAMERLFQDTIERLEQLAQTKETELRKV